MDKKKMKKNPMMNLNNKKVVAALTNMKAFAMTVIDSFIHWKNWRTSTKQKKKTTKSQ
jgi:hypothetical protein